MYRLDKLRESSQGRAQIANEPILVVIEAPEPKTRGNDIPSPSATSPRSFTPAPTQRKTSASAQRSVASQNSPRPPIMERSTPGGHWSWGRTRRQTNMDEPMATRLTAKAAICGANRFR